jgi:hypothetical protein
LRKTEETGGERFVIYDDFGKLTLVPASEMRLDVMLTEDGGTGFLRTVSIDKDTYNNVKLVRDTKNGREFFVASDAGNQAQWGKLQYLAKADEEEDAQAKANSLLNLYNKEQRTLSVTGVHGHPQVRAGCSLMVGGDLSGNPHGNPCVVERAIHRWTGGRWAMDLEVLVGEKVESGSSGSGAGSMGTRTTSQQATAAENFAGVEYEQIFSELPNLTSPVINNVNITGQGGGIYILSVSRADCTLDSRANPFFFFRSQNGAFEDYKVSTNGSTTVAFKGRNVLVGVGDNLGQTGFRTITL